MSKKKVLKIDALLFLQEYFGTGVKTCNHVKDALDISDWSFGKLEAVLRSLYNLGYRNMKVVEVKK